MKMILILSTMLLTSTVFADHSLKSKLEGTKNSDRLRNAIGALANARGVKCDLENSIQISVVEAANKIQTWRQLAFCYESTDKMNKANEYLKKGGIQMGAYGLPVDATIDVTYVISNDGGIEKVIDLQMK